MSPEQALQLIIVVLSRAPISKLEEIGLNEAFKSIHEALTPQKKES